MRVFHNYRIQMYRDKNGEKRFVRKGFINKRLKDYETQICETICSEFAVSKKK